MGQRVSAARAAVEARGETFYQGASRVHLAAFPPKSAGTTGWSSPRGPGRPARSTTTCWCPPPASTASRPAGCWRTSTRRPGRCASSRAIRSIPDRGAVTAPRVRPPSTRSPTRTGSSIRCAGPGHAARGDGNASAGRRPSTTWPGGSGPPCWKAAATRSWCTSADPARTASPSGCSPAGGWTATTATPTSAPVAGGPASSSGVGWTGRAPTMPTPRSSF